MTDDVTDFDPREEEPADPPNNGAVRAWVDSNGNLNFKGRGEETTIKVGSVGSPSTPVNGIHTEEVSVNKYGTGFTHTVFEEDGVYYAMDDSGSIVASDNTPDISAVLQSISDSVNPNGSVSDGESYVLQVAIQPKETPYNWHNTVTVRNGTRFALVSPGMQAAIVRHPSSVTQIDNLLYYDGKSEVDSGTGSNQIGYRFNEVTMRNIRFEFEQEVNKDYLRINWPNRVDLRHLVGHYTKFDMSDMLKRDDSNTPVPTDSKFFIALFSGSEGLAELSFMLNCHSIGAKYGFYIGMDHMEAHQLEVMYANPDPSGIERGAIIIDGDSTNEMNIYNTFVMDSAGYVIDDKRKSSTGPLNLFGINQEGNPPNTSGYNAQKPMINDRNGADKNIYNPYQVATDVSSPADGILSRTVVFGHNGEMAGPWPSSVTVFGKGGGAHLAGKLKLQQTQRRTLSGDISLSNNSAMVQNIDPGGVSRTVTLPAESNGLGFIIGNRADAAESLTVNDDSASTVLTINQNEVGYLWSDGTGWIGFSAAGGVT